MEAKKNVIRKRIDFQSGQPGSRGTVQDSQGIADDNYLSLCNLHVICHFLSSQSSCPHFVLVFLCYFYVISPLLRHFLYFFCLFISASLLLFPRYFFIYGYLFILYSILLFSQFFVVLTRICYSFLNYFSAILLFFPYPFLVFDPIQLYLTPCKAPSIGVLNCREALSYLLVKEERPSEHLVSNQRSSVEATSNLKNQTLCYWCGSGQLVPFSQRMALLSPWCGTTF